MGKGTTEACGSAIHIRDEAGENLQANHAMLLGSIEKSADIVDDGAMGIAVVPAQPGDTAEQSGKLYADVVL